MSAQTPSAPSDDQGGRHQRLGGLRVLVVDDQEDARDLMAVVLEAAGAQVALAESVTTAMKVVAQKAFGILVSDIGMPEHDGYDLIRRLRASEDRRKSRRLPAIAVTAFGAPEDRIKALAAGFDEHLPKPVDLIKLISVVERLAAIDGEEVK